MFILVLLGVLVLAAVVATVLTVHADGYGSAPAPRSHSAWDDADRLR